MKDIRTLFAIALLFIGCRQPDPESDVTQYIDLPREERILRTLSDEGYNGTDSLDMHFAFFTNDSKSAEVLAETLTGFEAYSEVRILNLPTHRGIAVVGAGAPMVANQENLEAFGRQLKSFSIDPGIHLISWGVQIYMAPRQDVDWEKIRRRNKVRKVRNTLKLMNKLFEDLLDKVKNADVNADNADDFKKDVEKEAREILGWKIDILFLLPEFYKSDFTDWYDNIIMICESLDELSVAILLPPAPGTPGFDQWKEDTWISLDYLSIFIDELIEMLQKAIDVFPPPGDGIPHPLEAHLKELKERLEQKKQMVEQVQILFETNADPTLANPGKMTELIKKCLEEKEWFIADLTYIFGEQFPIFGVTFYEWFHTLKGLDDALDPIINFEFRDPSDPKKTKADLIRLEQAIRQAKAWKEIMEKWELR